MPTDQSPTATPAIELREVTKIADERPIVRDVDWVVQPEDRWVVLGRNGCGKTTLLRIASLYLHPTTGSVSVLGNTLGRCDVRLVRERIGWSSASFADMLRPTLTATEIVMTARYAALEPWWHEYTDADRAHADELLARVGVGHLASRQFGTLSSGERQRVLLARALMNDPGVVLLDEPTAALDVGHQQDVLELIDHLRRRLGLTVVSTMHDLTLAAQYGDHLVLLADGRIVAEGPPIQVLTGPQIQRHYGAHVDVIDHRGHPVVVPVRTPHTDPPERPGHLEPEGDRHATT